MEARQVLVRPVLTEKSYGLLDGGVYTFVVHPEATKIEIRQAVEEVFGVRVRQVNTLRRRGKVQRNRRTGVRGRRADTKRAVVTLAGGDRIELLER
jgi:large subunit ribosomal protein L23